MHPFDSEDEVALEVQKLNKLKADLDERAKVVEDEPQPYIQSEDDGKPKVTVHRQTIPYKIRYVKINEEKSILQQRRNGEI